MKLKRIWITWENQRRNRELSQAFGAELFELTAIDEIENPFKKYICGIIKTLNILFKERPQLVFCQNPSIVLSFFMVLIKRFFRMTVCVDAHNAGIFPIGGRSVILNILSRFIQRKADLTLVTNENLRKHVEKNGGRCCVLQDKIPAIPVVETVKLQGEHNILFICSYADDEPYEAVFEASHSLSDRIKIYVTGNYEGKINPNIRLPKNIILTGYLSEYKFITMLHSVDAVMDLTTREDCIVCGAYESLAVEKPMVLSDTEALREYFRMGAVYADNTAKGIRKAICRILKQKKELTQQCKELKGIRSIEWEKRKGEVEQILGHLGRV